MISATALSASAVPLNKSPQIPIGLENSRLRVDSQKFLVPSLPVSSRQVNPRQDVHHHQHNPMHYQQQHSNASMDKRRAMQISPESGRIHNMNGVRRSTSPINGKGQNYGHNMQNSPRKDAHSPMYAGEVPGFSGSSSNYSRSSVPIPCSSPSPGTAASPKGSTHGTNAGGVYPHLPPVSNGASELSQLAVAAAAAAAASGNRLYPPGFPPPSAAHHAAFYAAAAAAAGHPLSYPALFGSSMPYPSHHNPNSYLDYSKLLRNQSNADIRSPSQSPPSRSYPPAQSPQQSHILPPIGSPQSTSVTSLHTKLIESVSAGDRYHSHNHSHGNNLRFPPSSTSPSGVSKGGPLGISGGIMGLTISPNSNSPHKGHSVATSATPEVIPKAKSFMEHPGLRIQSPDRGKSDQLSKEAMLLAKQRMITRSPEDFKKRHVSEQHQLQKHAKSISFANDGIHRPQFMNGHSSQHHPHHPHNIHHSSIHSDSKQLITVQAPQNPQHMFLPPSPKKRSAHWNFAVPQSPHGKPTDLLPPPPPPDSDVACASLSPSKYLSPHLQNQQTIQKPSNGGPHPPPIASAISTNSIYQSTAQNLAVPNSPLSSSSSSHGGSGPSTPKSPSVHFRFFANNKENVGASRKHLNGRTDSSSSTSSVELGVINGNRRAPLPVEQMPVISAFKKGSMIQLANGDLKAIEELNEKDFEKAVLMTESVKIVYCHVIAIQATENSTCKVTLAMGSAQNQQVVVDASPEQPFFIRGRGWSSSAPKLTEKLLQLPCTTLAVGDICITLTRQQKTPSVSSGGRGGKKSQTTRPYGTYSKSRNASTSSILKTSKQNPRGRKAVPTTPTTPSAPQSFDIPSQSPANRQPELVKSAVAMSPVDKQEAVAVSHASTMSTSESTSLVAPSLPSATKRKSISPGPEGSLDHENPSSPKKRRWSAPEQMDADPQQSETGEQVEKTATMNAFSESELKMNESKDAIMQAREGNGNAEKA